MTRLEAMTEAEFLDSFANGVRRVAEDNIARGLWSPDQALATSRSEMAQLLPQGRETPGFAFVKMLDEATGERVGETWFSVDNKGGRTHFWVHWIMVEPRFRRKGHARATLGQLSEKAREAGADRIGLFVMGDNREALPLYAALGFVPTSMRMAKSLGPSTS